ncbi:MAG: redox-regulated ATPase YchF [Patescibacteria group bacterium]|nr:redox-regulated ATPase YchF [Patescibacteria group bacterium]MBU2509271.1 redox-regulated ATPase YchF [Patescibacteria group bacterium]
MSLQIGIVGLPNVGKSTLFSAITKQAVDCANFPFCTIDPNVGVVEVPDERLIKLSEISKSKKTVPTTVEFVDIAGLVKGAAEGQGLGNKFLSHIRECDAIAQVLRVFQDPNVIHVDGAIDPIRDTDTIDTELALADLETVTKRCQGLEKQSKANSDKALEKELAAFTRARLALEKGEQLRNLDLSEDEIKSLRGLSLLTLKPMIYVANVSEQELQKEVELNLKGSVVPVCVKMEAELATMSDDERKEYLESFGQTQSGLERLIIEAYKTLGLITFLTSGEPETRAWTVVKGSKAPQAAGRIHTDFVKNFIRVEVVKYKDFIENGGWNGCKEKGLLRVEGKDYVIQDGDVCYFRIGG